MDSNPVFTQLEGGDEHRNHYFVEYDYVDFSDLMWTMKLICAEITTKEVNTSTGFNLGEVFLPEGNRETGCFPENFWLFPQPFAGRLERLRKGPEAPVKSIPTGKVAFIFDTTLPERGPVTITLEGIYDKKMGSICAIGCLRHYTEMGILERQNAFASSEPELVHDIPDCLVKVTIVLPRYFPWPLIYLQPPLRMKIESTRNPNDPLYFKTASYHDDIFITSEYMDAIHERFEAKDFGGILIGSIMVSCFVSQIRHLRKNEDEVTNISLLTPLSFSFGLTLSIISCVLEYSFRGVGGYLWGRFRSYSMTTPPPVQALFAVVNIISAYLSYQVVTLRHKKGYSWSGFNKRGRDGGGRDTELSLLQDEGEAYENSFVSKGKETLSSTSENPSTHWGPERSQILCLPLYIIAFLVSLGTLLQWYPLQFLKMLEERSSLYDSEFSRSMDSPTSSLSSPTSSSYAVLFYQTGVVVGMFGSLVQDMFLIPQIFLLSSMRKISFPLHPFFVYGLTITRLGAHLLEPFSIEVGIYGVLLSAVYYFLLNDFLLMKWKGRVYKKGQ